MRSAGTNEPSSAAAERILSEVLGGRVRLGPGVALKPPDRSGRSSIARHAVVHGPSRAPATVVVKQALAQGGDGYDADSAASGPARRLLNEWAGLALLGRAAGDVRLAPRLYGGDRAAGVLVLEDLAGVPLHDVLLGAAPDRAEQALVAYAVSLGRMHARTVGRQAEHARLRERLGPRLPPELTESTAAEAVVPITRLTEPFRAAANALGVALHDGRLAADLATVTAAWAAPGPFLAFTHGDPCPDNGLWRDGRVWLLDFEFGEFRHALTDAVCGHLLFPTCWCVGHLPEAVRRRMADAYRAALAEGCPAAGDDGVFARGLVAAAAYWVCGMFHWALPAVLERDEWWGTATWRQRVLVRLGILAGMTAAAGHLEALGAAAGAMETALRARWAGAVPDLPPYPAFRR